MKETLKKLGGKRKRETEKVLELRDERECETRKRKEVFVR